jgi:hypothetical protein
MSIETLLVVEEIEETSSLRGVLMSEAKGRRGNPRKEKQCHSE